MITFLLAVKKFFSMILCLIGEIMSYLIENPKVFFLIIAGIFIAGVSYHFGQIQGVKKQLAIDSPIIQQCNDAQIERQKKVAGLEVESFKAATLTTEIIKETKDKLSDVKLAYLKEKGKNSTLIKINDTRFKNGSVDVNVDSNGNLVCDRFGDAYLKSLNEMVREGNK